MIKYEGDTLSNDIKWFYEEYLMKTYSRDIVITYETINNVHCEVYTIINKSKIIVYVYDTKSEECEAIYIYDSIFELI